MLKKKPYLILFFNAVLFLVLGFVVSDSDRMDFNFHDTYYVVPCSHLCWIFAEFLGLFSLVYWILERIKVKMISILSLIHVWGTLFVVWGMPFCYFFISPSSESVAFPLFDDLERINFYMSLGALLFLIFQLLFIINIFVTIIKNLIKLGAK